MKEDYTPNSGTFLDSVYFSPETVLPTSYLLGGSEPEKTREIAPNTSKPIRRFEIDESPPRRSSHWIGLIASVSVGMVIAGFLFPMIQLAKRSARSYVTDSWTNEITRRVGQYEQIHANQGNTPHSEELQPYNLAMSSWQELCAEKLSHAPRTCEMIAIDGARTPFEALIDPMYARRYTHSPPDAAIDDSAQHSEATVVQSRHSINLLAELTEFHDWCTLASSDMISMADTMLLVTPGQETLVRSAFGQNILIKDGRVFFRVLP